MVSFGQSTRRYVVKIDDFEEDETFIDVIKKRQKTGMLTESQKLTLRADKLEQLKELAT